MRPGFSIFISLFVLTASIYSIVDQEVFPFLIVLGLATLILLLLKNEYNKDKKGIAR